MKNFKTKVTILALLVIVSIVGYNIYGQVSMATGGMEPKERAPGAPAPDSGRLAMGGRRGPMGDGPMFSEAERKQMATDIGLSKEQQEKIDAIMQQGPPEKPEDGMKRFQEIQAIMTPEQQKKAMEVMRERGEKRMQERLEKARKLMSDADFKDYKEKMEGMRERRRNGQPAFPGAPTGGWGRRGGGPGGPGGPGGGAPPQGGEPPKGAGQ